MEKKEFKNRMYNDLGVICLNMNYNPALIIVACRLIDEFAENGIFEISIGRGEFMEIVFWSKEGVVFKNLVIDEDGDVSYIKVADKLGNEDSGYYKNAELDYNALVNLLK